jgi:uncharacterized membrane protein YsdA (DUF1294 family)/cold shock CspA family protein
MSPTTPSVLTAKIVEWNRQKAYGFLAVGNHRVFLHSRDFAERHKKPEIGDQIQFVMGQDAKGRPCAKHAVHLNDGGRITPLNLVSLLILLILPAIALHRLKVDLRWVGAYALLLSLLAYAAYALDKRRARANQWRISEAWLHSLELLGGWPGAFLAQRRLRHKCSKASYQFLFWTIVLAHQFAALDSLQDWRLSRTALNWLQTTSQHRR